MNQSKDYSQFFTLAKTSSLEDFIKVAVDNKDDPKALKRLKKGLQATEKSLLTWQKREALGMIAEKQTPVASEMNVPARLAFEIGQIQKRFGTTLTPIDREIVDEEKFEISPAAVAELTSAISRGPTPVKKILEKKLITPSGRWFRQNWNAYSAFRKEYSGTIRVILDKLPEAGQPMQLRLTSPEFERKEAVRHMRQEFSDFVSEGLHTRRPVPAPEKAAFRKRSGPRSF